MTWRSQGSCAAAIDPPVASKGVITEHSVAANEHAFPL